MAPHPTLPGSSAVVPLSNVPAGLYDTSNVPVPAEPYRAPPPEAKPTIGTHPADKFIQAATAETDALEPTVATLVKGESDAAEPAAREPQVSTSFDQVGFLNLAPVMHKILLERERNTSLHKKYVPLNILNSFIKMQLTSSELYLPSVYCAVLIYVYTHW